MFLVSILKVAEEKYKAFHHSVRVSDNSLERLPACHLIKHTHLQYMQAYGVEFVASKN